jgi:hypothetical protein
MPDTVVPISQTASGVEYELLEASIVSGSTEQLVTYVLPTISIAYIALVLDAELVVDGTFGSQLYDSLIILDQVALQTNKLNTDTFAISDSSYWQLSTTKQDTVNVTDQVTLVAVFTRTVPESFSVVDTGRIYMNGYCEAGYCTEDYVGELRLF